MSEVNTTTSAVPDNGTLELPSRLVPERSIRFWAMVIPAVLTLLLLPVILSPFQLFFATVIFCFLIAAVGLNIVTGYSGQISIAHAGLMGIGAYTTTLLMSLLDVTFVLALPLGAAFATGIGCIVAIPALRIRGHYLALATLAFQLIFYTIISNWVDLTGGPNGLRVPPADAFGVALDDRLIYWMVGTFALLGLIVSRNLARSRFGRALIALREEQLLAEVMGVGLTRYKILAFAASAFYAGLAGGLFAVTVSFLDPAAFNLWVSISFLVMVIFGGLGTVAGPIIGAVLVQGSPEFFRGFEEHWPLIYFGLLIVVLIVLPMGVIGGAQKVLVRFVPTIPARSHYEIGTREVAPEQGQDEPAELVLTREPPDSHSGGPLLKVQNVSLQFGGLKALSGVDLELAQGEVSGLIGPNGAGKTTLFNVMTRVLAPDEGTVEFAGVDLAKYRTDQIVGLGLSRTFQNVEVCETMTVAENVILGMHHRLESGILSSGFRVPKTIREERRASLEARALLEELGFIQYAETPVGDLPLGLQRRVEIARALASHPLALLLDEPASGLSQSEANSLMEDIRRLRDYGITVLVIEHNVRFVMGLCNRITVLDRGAVIYQGTPAGAQNDERVIEAYLGKEDVDGEEDLDAEG